MKSSLVIPASNAEKDAAIKYRKVIIILQEFARLFHSLISNPVTVWASTRSSLYPQLSLTRNNKSLFTINSSPLTPMGYGSGMVPEPPVCDVSDSDLCKGGFLGYPRYELGYRQPPHPYVNHHGYQHEPASPPPGNEMLKFDLVFG